ncbi:MAG: crotonase/enoyl-CoA hydratase family protein [Solirubrobacterales bacterium]|jgi:enoyl-CoA hydratase|nr:crotonase/enoyl-CoA hydratase family protein [Solirubrobacterales bacterium]
MSKVLYERAGAAALLTINRPERRNAVDPETADRLLEGYERFVADDQARVLVLTGDEQAFSAGADLKSVTEAVTDETLAKQWLADRPNGPLGFTRLTSPKPTIAAISGYALAGGLELALWCDLRIGTETARLGFPERRWGVPLIDGGTQRLPRIVGMGRGLDLILSGRIVEADEAREIGLLTEVVPPGRHVERALEMAEGLAAFPQKTMLSDRRAAIEGLGLPLDDALTLEAEIGADSTATGIEGAARFASGEGRGGEGAGV